MPDNKEQIVNIIIEPNGDAYSKAELIERLIREARIEELERLKIRFIQNHELSDGYKHLIHEEAANDVIDRLQQLKAGERDGNI